MNRLLVLFSLLGILHQQQTTAQVQTVESPDKTIVLKIKLLGGRMYYSIEKNRQPVLLSSPLGLQLSKVNLYEQLKVTGTGAGRKIEERYHSTTGKKSGIRYQATEKILKLANPGGIPLEIISRVSNDGVAFRYHIPAANIPEQELIVEKTAYHFPDTARSWLQPMSEAKTGWEQSNPSYEEDYFIDQQVGKPSKAGWVYPALFRSNKEWVLITEAGVDSLHAATRLVNDSGKAEYRIGQPDPREIFPSGGLLSKVSGNWYSAWRIVTIGDLATITSSTLGTDLASPTKMKDLSFVKGGQASWSWINSKDDFIVYAEQKRYVDYAAEMGWEYCLVDVNWDTKIGMDSIAILASYAASKKVGLILWYNSAGSWNTTPYHPRDQLLTRESRRATFDWLQKIGIKGVKIDFFGGDGQSVMAYYHAILKDAADYKLLVNFHGATLPRGWQRTYPHLVTAEAVKGFEMVTFGQEAADRQAVHCTMLPFTRNVFDPMDFTPMNLYQIPTSVKRKTSTAFELALSVLFWSGIQHYAESPEGMAKMPDFAKELLRSLPNYWDDMKWVEGYPGEYVVLARRYEKKWYIAGINASKESKTINLETGSYAFRTARLVVDGDPFLREITYTKETLPETVTIAPNAGFVLELK